MPLHNTSSAADGDNVNLMNTLSELLLPTLNPAEALRLLPNFPGKEGLDQGNPIAEG